MVWFHQPCLPSPISMLFLSLIFPLWSLNLWSTSNNWKLHLKTSDSVSSRTCPVLSNRFRMRFSASLQSSTTNHLALRIQCLCRCDEIEGPHKVSDFILTFAIWGLISIVLGLCWSHPIRCRVSTSQWLFRTVLASPSRRYVRLIECNEAHENEAYQDPTGGLSINKHIAQLLDVPLSTITDYFPSKLEFNTALWHYFPVAPENMSAERDGFINGIHEHRPRKFPDLSDSVPPRSTGAKSHGRMDHPMVKGAVVCNTGESFVLSL